MGTRPSVVNSVIRNFLIGWVFISMFVPIGSNAQCGMTVDITADPPYPWNLCPGETITLISEVTGGTGPYTYIWADGATTPNTVVIPPFTGNYFLIVTDANGCIAENSIHIKAWVWTVDFIFAPSTFCWGDSMALYAWPDFPAGTTFLWSTGDTTNPIFITDSGTYSVTATSPGGGCSSSHTAFVGMTFFPQPDPAITGPSVLCPGQNATLTAQGDPDDIYLWNTGDETSSIMISTPNTYSVSVTNSFGCTGVDTIEVLPGSSNPLISAPSILCNGQSGTIVITNASSYTDFDWSTGETTSSITINTAGTYSVTVTASGGCTATGSVTVNAGSSNINLTGTTAPVTSCTNPNGSINLSVTPSGSYSFLWSNGFTTEDINNLTAGNYTVTVTDAGGCTSSSSFTVTSNVIVPAATSIVTPSSCNQGNGAVNLNVAPPGTYTFIWSNGATTEDLSNITTGTYSVTVTATSSGCSTTSSAMVPNNDISIAISGNTTPFTSCSTPNGAVDITTSPSGTYTYIWSNGSTTEDLSNVNSGSYTVTVSAGGSCTATATFDVQNNTSPPIPTTNASADTCNQNTGTIDLNVVPVTTYTFLWSNGATTEDITNIPAGIYGVTITSPVSGCSATITDTVTNYVLPIVVTPTPLASTCGQSNGAVDLNVSPSGSYTFNWSNGSTAEDLNGIPNGNYSVTVTSAEGCTSTASVLLPDTVIPLTINGTSSPNTSCVNENGAIDITVIPAGSYSYLWSNGTVTEDLNNVPSGVYTVTVTLGLTCVNTQSFDVLNSITMISATGTTTPNSSCSQPNGTIDILVSPPGPYTYLWSNGETTEDLQQLSGGIYSVTVTGDNGCTATESFTIINTNSNFSFSVLVLPNTSCTSPNGSIDLTPSPAGTYSFAWTTGAITEDLQNLMAGSYSVTVTDINDCDLVETFLVTDNLSYPVITSQVTPSTCGNSNGSIDISVIPATGNLFAWSNGASGEDVFNLAAGNYVVSVTGANGCVTIDTISVGNLNSSFTLSATTLPNTSCTSPNGSIDLTVSPSGTFSYSWSDGSTNEDLQLLAAGTYSVTVSDVLNCFTSDSFLVLNNTSVPSLSATLVPATCGANNGSLDLFVFPTANATFLWSNGATTEDLQNLLPGSYSVAVTDTTNGCQALDTFSIQNINTNFSLSAVSLPNTSCLSANGGIDLTVIPGGAYTFAWSGGAATEDISNLGSGLYIVTVTDMTSCSSIDTFEVLNNTFPVTLSALISPSSCGLDNGAIDITPVPSNGNIFLWSNGRTTEDLQNLSSGNYTLTVTGANGCTTIDSFLVPDVGSVISLLATTTANSHCVFPNGSIDLSVAPAGTYNFNWSNGTSTEDQTSLTPGSYSVTVTDGNGCSSAGLFVVLDQIILPVITETIIPALCGEPNGQIDLTILPPGSYTFSWSNGSVVEDLQNMVAGSYTVTVTSTNGCTASSVFLVPNTNSNFSISGLTSANTSCITSNGSIDITVAPVGNYTFSWSNGMASEDLNNLQPGIYTVTVTDLSNCASTGMFVVDDQTVDLDVSSSITPGLCGDVSGNIDLEVTPSSGNSFLWSNGQTGEDLADVLPGMYSVTITGQNGCTWFSSFTLAATETVTVDLQADLVGTQGDSTTITVATNIDIGTIDTVMWLPEILFSCTQNNCMQQTILTPVQPTEIRVMVIDTNGCAGEARLVLRAETNPIVYIPNVFSPNRDGFNDLFTVYGNEDVELVLELQIFDRWGNQVFVNDEFPPNEEQYGWNGEFKHQLMNPAVFAYWARLRFVDGSVGAYKGDVTLVR